MHGYRCGVILGETYRAHRIVWAHHFGAWPEGEVDHVNGDRSDNRVINLRDVSRTENARNCRKGKGNTSGFVGVRWRPDRSVWSAEITIDGRKQALGHFRIKRDAIEARINANRAHGFHTNHGRDGGANV